jgi:hypothetical protein
MSQDKSTGESALNIQQLWQRVPEPLRVKVAALRQQFLAAKKSTQYALSAALILIVAFLITLGGNSADEAAGSITFTVRRGNLDITVLEGGSLEALRSQEIRSGVKGREGVKILKIVEEGYSITPEDVAAGKILVELDKAQLIDEQLNQEIAVETAEASYIERKAQYEIQLNQNMTDLNDARQDMRFARLDFEKFLGGNIVNEIIQQLEIEERLARAEQADLEAAQLAAAPAIRQEAISTSTDLPFQLESLPPQMQERIRQSIEENGGSLPAEMLQRMQNYGQDGARGWGARATKMDANQTVESAKPTRVHHRLR